MKKYQKNILAIVMIISLSLLTACSGTEANNASSAEVSAVSSQVVSSSGETSSSSAGSSEAIEKSAEADKTEIESDNKESGEKEAKNKEEGNKEGSKGADGKQGGAEEGPFSLDFDKEAYIMHEDVLPDGSIVKYRTYNDIVYEATPVLPEQAKLTIYVPEEYFNDGAVGKYTADTAPIFLKNEIGGYMQASIAGLTRKGRDGSVSVGVNGEMLKHGLVVVSAATRGNNSELDENGVTKGLAPAGIVDMKAVIRYLHYNDAEIPGNAERIISDGTSAGGAISALIGTSGNDPAYDEYLEAVGAADARDDVYAAFCYVPILDMENLNEAYEWFYMGTGLDWYQGKSTWSKNDENHVDMTEYEKILSPLFAETYIDYINSKQLISPLDGTTPLTLDENGEGTYRELWKKLLIASAQESLNEKGELVGMQYDGTADCFTIENGKVTDVDAVRYLQCIQRLTGVGAMDNGYCVKNQYGEDMGLVQTNEAKVFALNGADVMVHFDKNLYPSMVTAIEQGADFSHIENFNVEDFQLTEGLDPDDPESIVYLMNPLNFIGDEDSDTAPNFFVCAGACDNDVSMITATLLGASLYTAKEIDEDSFVLKYEWDQKHGGDYDIAEMTDWIDSICFPIDFDGEGGEDRTAEVEGTSISYTAYENIVYTSNPMDTRYQKLNLYVPEGADESTPVFLQNNSGGYGSSKAGDDTNETTLALLAKGYVIASIGLRGQNAKIDNGDGTTTYTGRAPASVVDLKAAIRYLRYNDQAIPGSADKMIMGGTSSGGGTTAIVGVTADSPEYEPYLEEIGAADASDELYACVCYCPVFNVDSSDLSYAWQVQDMTESIDSKTAAVRSFINGKDLGLFHNERNGYTVDENGVYVLDERELALTEYFADCFPAYMNEVLAEIGLEDLKISDDGRTGTFTDFLLEQISNEYNRYMTENWSAEVINAFINGTGYKETYALEEVNPDSGTFDVDRSGWLSYDEASNTVSVTDLWKFFEYVGLLKSAPAFDGKRETNVYGETVVANDVTGTVFDPWLAEYDGKEVSEAVLQQEHLYSVFDFLTDKETPNTANWFIRYGTIDNGVHAYPALLAASLEKQGQNVDYRMAFERTHSGYYELDELMAWLDSIL